MIWRKVFRIIPVPIFITDTCVNHAGKNCGIWIAIKPKYATDRTSLSALIEHELVHSKQFYRTLGFHSILYWLSAKYRLKAELEAYKETIRVYKYNRKADTMWIATSLYKHYNLEKDYHYNEILERVYKIFEEVQDESRNKERYLN